MVCSLNLLADDSAVKNAAFCGALGVFGRVLF